MASFKRSLMKKVKEKKYPRIRPKFIKNEKGETIQAFLDMKSYKSLIDRLRN